MKNLLMKVFGICVILCIISCGHKSTDSSATSCEEDTFCCPHAVIYLQPYDDFTQKEAEVLCEKIHQGLDKVYAGDWSKIKVLPNKPLPARAYYQPKNRYLANELLKDLPSKGGDAYIIGLTHKDISYKVHGYQNYGIMGLSPMGGMKSIVSDFRSKRKQFVPVIVHEFGHGYYRAEHCSDVNCVMCDYQKHKGRPIKYGLCIKHEYMG